jgi:phosphonate transport system substrate-binding protein
LGEEFADVDAFVPVTYQQDWVIIRSIQGYLGVEYTSAQLLELR